MSQWKLTSALKHRIYTDERRLPLSRMANQVIQIKPPANKI